MSSSGSSGTEAPESQPGPASESERRGPGSWTNGILSIAFLLVLHFASQAFIKLVSFSKPVTSVNPYDGSWSYLWEHHAWELALALLLLGLFSRGNWRAWGCTLQNWRSSLSLLWKFCLVYGCIEVPYLVYTSTHGSQTPVHHQLAARNVVAWLGFAWLMPGLAEETMFRGFMHSFLRRSWPGVWRWGRLEIPVAGFIAALIFSAAHIGIKWHPFQVTHLEVGQLLTAFVLGLYYSIAYHKTGSLLNPILAHNFSDGIIFSTLYILAACGA